MSVVGKHGSATKIVKNVAKKSTTKAPKCWPPSNFVTNTEKKIGMDSTAESSVYEETLNNLKALNGDQGLVQDSVSSDIILANQNGDKTENSANGGKSPQNDLLDTVEGEEVPHVSTDEEDNLLLQLSDTESSVPVSLETTSKLSDNTGQLPSTHPLAIGVKVRKSVRDIMSKLVQECTPEVNKILSKSKTDNSLKDTTSKIQKTNFETNGEFNKLNSAKTVKENLFEIMSAESEPEDLNMLKSNNINSEESGNGTNLPTASFSPVSTQAETTLEAESISMSSMTDESVSDTSVKCDGSSHNSNITDSTDTVVMDNLTKLHDISHDNPDTLKPHSPQNEVTNVQMLNSNPTMESTSLNTCTSDNSETEKSSASENKTKTSDPFQFDSDEDNSCDAPQFKKVKSEISVNLNKSPVIETESANVKLVKDDIFPSSSNLVKDDIFPSSPKHNSSFPPSNESADEQKEFEGEHLFESSPENSTMMMSQSEIDQFEQKSKAFQSNLLFDSLSESSTNSPQSETKVEVKSKVDDLFQASSPGPSLARINAFQFDEDDNSNSNTFDKIDLNIDKLCDTLLIDEPKPDVSEDNFKERNSEKSEDKENNGQLEEDVEMKEDVEMNEDAEIKEEDVEKKEDDVEKKEDDIEMKKVEMKKDNAKMKKDDVEMKKDDVEMKKDDVEMMKEDVEMIKEDVEMKKEDVEMKKKDVKINDKEYPNNNEAEAIDDGGKIKLDSDDKLIKPDEKMDINSSASEVKEEIKDTMIKDESEAKDESKVKDESKESLTAVSVSMKDNKSVKPDTTKTEEIEAPMDVDDSSFSSGIGATSTDSTQSNDNNSNNSSNVKLDTDSSDNIKSDKIKSQEIKPKSLTIKSDTIDRKRSVDTSDGPEAPPKRSRLDIMIGKLGDQIGIKPESVPDAIDCDTVSDSEEESRAGSDEVKSDEEDVKSGTDDEVPAPEKIYEEIKPSKVLELDDKEETIAEQENVKDKQKNVEDKQQNVEDKLQNVEDKLQNVEDKLQTVEDKQQNVEEKLRTVENEQQNVEDKHDVDDKDIEDEDVQEVKKTVVNDEKDTATEISAEVNEETDTDDDVKVIGSEEPKSDKVITSSSNMDTNIETVIRKRVLQLIKSYRDEKISTLELKIGNLNRSNEKWRNTAKDLQKQVVDLTIVQQRLEKRKAAAAALKIITSRTIGCQVDSSKLNTGSDATHISAKTSQYNYTSVTSPNLVSMIKRPTNTTVTPPVNNMSQLLSATAESRTTTINSSPRPGLTSVRNLLETTGRASQFNSSTTTAGTKTSVKTVAPTNPSGPSVKVIDLTADEESSKKLAPPQAKPQQMTMVPVTLPSNMGGPTQILRPIAPGSLPPGASILLSGPSGTQIVNQSQFNRMGGSLQVVTVSAGNNQIRPGSFLTVVPSTAGNMRLQTVSSTTPVPSVSTSTKPLTIDASALTIRPPAPIPSTTTHPTVKNMIQNKIAQAQHPAALPPQPINKTPNGGVKGLVPPKPDLKISRVSQGIVLSWTITQNLSLYSEISSYQLFAYQESQSPPNSNLWKKVGDVKALPLPMACTLTQFQEGNKYHFAVRAMDVYQRISEFSEPSSIHLFTKSS